MSKDGAKIFVQNIDAAASGANMGSIRLENGSIPPDTIYKFFDSVIVSKALKNS
ncbi:hypothetical protein MNBD_NITROSPINAE02-1553 [hydrothermal vent metagenome]|uniref:Uncharacterized protein n=1 Tax=hydrothermal vent metagenome TaxID=652676 RepID=A0A3B1CJB7_9ZZZZ